MNGDVRFRAAHPVLHVACMATADAFYGEQLGFTRMFAYRLDETRADPCYTGWRRGDAWLHTSSFPGDGVAGGVVHLVVDDVDALHAEFTARNVVIALPPTEQTWGNREMYVKDPDGNALRFSNG